MFDYCEKSVEVALIASKVAKHAHNSKNKNRLIVLEIIEAAKNSAMAANKANSNKDFAREWYNSAMQWAKVAIEKSQMINIKR